MIQKLRVKFVFINMFLVSMVLVVVFGVVITASYHRALSESQVALRAALSWSAEAPPPRFEFGKMEWRAKEGERHIPLTPAFVVTLDGDGNAAGVTGGGNVDVSDATVAEALTLVKEGEATGVISSLSLRYLRDARPDGVERIAFADLTAERDALWSTVLTSILVGGAALVGFFVISLFLSGIALKPVETAWEQQRRFVADASHELKTPLTVILTNTGILLAHPEDPLQKQIKWVEYIREEAQRMKGLVEDLLFLAKNDATRENAAATAQVDFSQLLWSALLPFESVAFEQGAELVTQVSDGLLVTGRADQLRRLCGILLDNAVKYTAAGGTITVRLDRTEKNIARLIVQNTGPPIPPEHLEHLFERFYRADDSRARDSGGYGLGLAIAKSIMDTHHGTITVSSTPETGTGFTVKLPLGGIPLPSA